MLVECRDGLNTTNIDLPRRVFKTYDIQYTFIDIISKDITQIFYPAIGILLRESLRILNVAPKIKEIEPGAFDELPNLKNLSITSQLDDSALLSKLVLRFILFK